ncbi:MAG: hypothetical protein JW940_27795 [Polyangiaceae bacterium]|nr:hypothetical protein [Polyangiaceae bacterium]
MTSYRTIGIGIALGLLGCGGQVTLDKGTESHWLRSCSDDGDCTLGHCLCGRCTLECDQDTDCRWPLDVCVAPGEERGLEACVDPPKGLCGISTAPEGTSRLSEALVIEREQCLGNREVRSVRVPIADPSWEGTPTAFVNEQFVFAGMPSRVDIARIGLDGTAAQSLTVESALAAGSQLGFTDLIAHPDGRIALVGNVAPDGSFLVSTWVGVLDAEGQLSSEQLLDVDVGEPSDLGFEPLAGGGYVYARMLKPASDQNVLVWSRLDERGAELWQKRIDLEREINEIRGGMVVTTDETIQVLMIVDEQLCVVTSDLDGSYVEHRHDAPKQKLLAGVAALPDGLVAALTMASSEPIMTAIGPDGSVGWQKSYGSKLLGHHARTTITYHAQFDEILLYGDDQDEEFNPRFRIIGLDVLGNQRWEYNDLVDSGFGIYPMVAADDGRLIALKQASTAWPELTYYVIEPPSCP